MRMQSNLFESKLLPNRCHNCGGNGDCFFLSGIATMFCCLVKRVLHVC